MDSLLGAVLVFSLRVTDVSLGTIRVIEMVRGRRWKAAALGFVESGVFIIAITRIFSNLDDPVRMVGYAAGFATGTALGMTLEAWIASGWIVVRIISRDRSAEIAERLRGDGFGVTALAGEGSDLPVRILFLTEPRRRGPRLLEVVREVDPTAFVSMDPVTMAMGGHLPHVAAPASVRK